METLKLRDKHAVVTGGGTGIGAAIAAALAADGARVTLLGRRLEPLDAIAAALPEARGVGCDVTDPASIALAFDKAQVAQGLIDILVNNAGAAETAPFHKLDIQHWRRMMAVNLEGVFNCTRAVYDEMRGRGWGRIVNVASTAALKGYAYVSAYCAAKHGVLGLTRALALEAAPSGLPRLYRYRYRTGCSKEYRRKNRPFGRSGHGRAHSCQPSGAPYPTLRSGRFRRLAVPAGVGVHNRPGHCCCRWGSDVNN